jgi:hypothetical protein
MSEIGLPRLPEGFSRTRESMHRLAERVVKVAREQATGEFSLIRTPGGFGTPTFGGECQVRVEGTELVVREHGEERRGPITTLRAAAELVGPRLLPGDLDVHEEPLDVDPAAAKGLAASYALGEAVLERLIENAGDGDEPTQPTLWPEHFDIAIEVGPEADGLRVNYGVSPGDEHHPEPYFYVGPWSAPPSGELWNGTGFAGAELSYAELAAAEDPIATAVDFALERKRSIEETKGR